MPFTQEQTALYLTAILTHLRKLAESSGTDHSGWCAYGNGGSKAQTKEALKGFSGIGGKSQGVLKHELIKRGWLRAEQRPMTDGSQGTRWGFIITDKAPEKVTADMLD